MYAENNKRFLTFNELGLFTIEVCKAHMKELGMVALFTIVANILFSLIQAGAMASMQNGISFIIPLIVTFLVLGAQFLVSSFTIIAIIHIVKCYFEDREVVMEDLIDFIKLRLPPYFMFYLAMFVASIILGIVIGVLFGLAVAFEFFVVIAIILGIAAIPITIIFSIIYYFVIHCVIFFGSNPIDALKQSAELTSGHRFDIFLRLFFMGLASSLVGAISTIVTALLSEIPIIGAALSQMGSTSVLSLMTIFVNVFTCIMFLNLHDLNNVGVGDAFSDSSQYSQNLYNKTPQGFGGGNSQGGFSNPQNGFNNSQNGFNNPQNGFNNPQNGFNNPQNTNNQFGNNQNMNNQFGNGQDFNNQSSNNQFGGQDFNGNQNLNNQFGNGQDFNNQNLNNQYSNNQDFNSQFGNNQNSDYSNQFSNEQNYSQNQNVENQSDNSGNSDDDIQSFNFNNDDNNY